LRPDTGHGCRERLLLPGAEGPFYPDKLPAADFLRYYAEHLPTVEINNTFYRVPGGRRIERRTHDFLASCSDCAAGAPRHAVIALISRRSGRWPKA
jgi:hypothetical protein